MASKSEHTFAVSSGERALSALLPGRRKRERTLSLDDVDVQYVRCFLRAQKAHARPKIPQMYVPTLRRFRGNSDMERFSVRNDL
jgi:hypothetical protein